jgi:2-polyprenyl-6-methoxyphenol hydroxylase-like FAD-dependent oxidoreductase
MEMKALIVGAGVCGPVTAMALERVGINVVVYDAHGPTAADAGSYLTVATNGLDALRANWRPRTCAEGRVSHVPYHAVQRNGQAIGNGAHRLHPR